ncbi:hypothetical protein [Jannaschia sp. R86511]|uniref:hypothetical protein n=1 Tax=Jannaschia sp. R86511 TaxID=3093853 RepID=UPI0036D208B0
MTDTREAVLIPRVRPPDVLWVPFAVLGLLGLGTTLAAIVYLAIVTMDLVAGDASLQWQAFPFGIGMLVMGIGALMGVAALWRQRRRARVVALGVLPLFIAAGAADGLVVNDSWGLRLNPFVALSLLLPAVAWAIFLLPSVRDYYKRLVR